MEKGIAYNAYKIGILYSAKIYNTYKIGILYSAKVNEQLYMANYITKTFMKSS